MSVVSAPSLGDSFRSQPDDPNLAAKISAQSSQRISPKFGRNNQFQSELRKRVDEFFLRTGRPRRDVPAMYLKTSILITATIVFYLLLVFVVHTPALAIPIGILLGLSTAGIGFNIQHDGGHQAYSRFSWINKIAAFSLDVIGGSSYLWHYKHGVYHHTYVNITHEDTDIDMGVFARVTPHQHRYWFHRWQHLYIWPLYGLFVIKWHFFDDYQNVLSGHIGVHKIPRPRGWDLATFIAGKLMFLSLVIGIPLLRHSFLIVALEYFVVATTMGCVLSVVFQLAHAVGTAEFPLPLEETGDMESAWAIHQVQTTVDFARKSKVASWLMGGLNFQIEHHLLPKICHVNFPALSEIVSDMCREWGIQYNEHKSFAAGIVSHFRWLREMGARPS